MTTNIRYCQTTNKVASTRLSSKKCGFCACRQTRPLRGAARSLGGTATPRRAPPFPMRSGPDGLHLPGIQLVQHGILSSHAARVAGQYQSRSSQCRSLEKLGFHGLAFALDDRPGTASGKSSQARPTSRFIWLVLSPPGAS